MSAIVPTVIAENPCISQDVWRRRESNPRKSPTVHADPQPGNFYCACGRKYRYTNPGEPVCLTTGCPHAKATR